LYCFISGDMFVGWFDICFVLRYDVVVYWL